MVKLFFFTYTGPNGNIQLLTSIGNGVSVLYLECSNTKI